MNDPKNPPSAAADWEAEKAVIALLVTSASNPEIGSAEIHPEFLACFEAEDFTHAAYRKAAKVIHRELVEGRPIDLVSIQPVIWAEVADETDRSWIFEAMTCSVGDVAHGWGALVARLDSARRVRELRLAAKEITRLAEEGEIEDATLQPILERLGKRREGANRGRTLSGRKGAMELLEHIELAQTGKAEKGISTGIPALDRQTRGFLRKHYWVFGARTSVGKTAVMISTIRHAVEAGMNVVFVTLEMDGKRIVQRLASQMSAIPVSAMEEERGMTAKQMPRLAASLQTIRDSKLTLVEPSSRDISETMGRLRAESSRGQIDLIVVDYLQKFKSSAGNKNTTRQSELADVSAELQSAAKEFNCCVVTAGQLNRGAENRDDGPRLSDLRECGDIEQDADVVVLLDRPDMLTHNLKVEEAEMNVAKNRDGALGVIRADFNRSLMMWEESKGGDF